MSVVPVDASTVMLLRPCSGDDEEGIEVLLVLRNRRSSFVPGYYVYPGGVIDAEDYGPGMERFVYGLDRHKAASLLGDMQQADKALGVWVAAVRETFEEAGLLLARRRDGSPLALTTEAERNRFGRYRRSLVKKEIAFSSILETEELVLNSEDLLYFSHWITPEPLPKRYDVRFFMAAHPAGQCVSHDGVELTSHVWIGPAEALRQYDEGKIGMVLPQIMTLRELSRFRMVEEALQCAKKKHVEATRTKMAHLEGRYVEVMPDGEVFHHRPPVYSWPDEKD
jgi:8-oxo-dGTP pyrophosphatase MutT (NUDIX family)